MELPIRRSMAHGSCCQSLDSRQEFGTQGKKAYESFVASGQLREVHLHITVGDDIVDCSGPLQLLRPRRQRGCPRVLSLSDHSYQPAYTASVGWDFTTGIGSVNATNLVFNPIWAEGVGP